ncbi:MAG TPA: hypothetical protein VGU45_01465 [Microvirga sp.]|jgi:hypothetical protein|nr:hypothetical protein [Microvirga sp.]
MMIRTDMCRFCGRSGEGCSQEEAAGCQYCASINTPAFALREMEFIFRHWLDWNEVSRKAQGLHTDDDTKIMRPPEWPSRGNLKVWVAALRAGQREAEEANQKFVTLRSAVDHESERADLAEAKLNAMHSDVQSITETGDRLAAQATDAEMAREAVLRLTLEQGEEIGRLEGQIAELKQYEVLAHFVLKWCDRGPPHGGPGREAEALEWIRHHPVLADLRRRHARARDEHTKCEDAKRLRGDSPASPSGAPAPLSRREN